MTSEVLLVLRAILAGSLFVFLGWVVWVFWRELQTNVSIIAARKHPPLAILIEYPDGKSSENFTFEDSEITIGRDPTCELHLEDDVISAHHARFSFHHSQWWLEDLHSTNGTSLNGEPLETATVVIVGDVITCGGIQLTLGRADRSIDSRALQSKNISGERDG